MKAKALGPHGPWAEGAHAINKLRDNYLILSVFPLGKLDVLVNMDIHT